MKELTVVYELTSVEFLFERGRTLYGKEPDHYTNPKNGNWDIGVGATIALFLEDPSPKCWTEINNIVDRAKGYRYLSPVLRALTKPNFFRNFKKMGKVIKIKNSNKIELHSYLRNQKFIGDSSEIVHELYMNCT